MGSIFFLTDSQMLIVISTRSSDVSHTSGTRDSASGSNCALRSEPKIWWIDAAAGSVTLTMWKWRFARPPFMPAMHEMSFLPPPG